MAQLKRGALAALAVLGSLPAYGQAERIPPYALRAWDEVKGLAAQPAFEWARKQRMVCDTRDGGTEPCTVATRTQSVQIFSPDPDLSLVVIYFNPSTGNAGITSHLLLGRKKDGTYRVLRELEKAPGELQKVSLEGKALILEVAILKPDDARCCPSGLARYRYDLRDDQITYLWGDRPER